VKYLFLISFFLVSLNIFAQDPPGEMWFSVSVPIFFGKKKDWQWNHDASYRTNGMNLVPHLYLYRTGIRHQLNAHFNIAAGAALLFTRVSYDKDDHEFGQESRLYQELVYQTNQSAQFRFQSRFRIEERFFEAVTNRAAYDAARFRYRGSLAFAATQNYLVQVAEEYMHQLANDQMKFNQNRVYASLIRTFGGQSQIQLAYIWQYRTASSQNIIAVTFQKSIGSNGNN
jgi:Protein of unknown function (DUF2490)